MSCVCVGDVMDGAKHLHISHTPSTPHIPRTTLIHNTSAAIDTIPDPRVPPTCHALTTPHPSLTPAFSSTSHHQTLSADTNNSIRITVVVVVCPLQPSSSVKPGCLGPESSVPVSSRLACPISSQMTDHWGEP